VLVVENPAVVAVAAADGFEGTVVCSSGRPSVAVMVLLSQLASAGAAVDVHADFDPAGFGIVAGLVAAGYRPWRMTAADYLDVVALSAGEKLGEATPLTPWDPELATLFDEHRRPVYEEQILDLILQPRAG
jgi:uncharacterized protein (TIGR02679 family)